jgi:PhzF family phenazine biosynthesis protein
MTLNIYQVDAFASEVYKGNPAAIVPLQEWLPVEIMQSIAAENNLAETAFFVKEGEQFHIRWFTPLDEVPLCGHATLASAYVIFNELGYDKDVITFTCKSGLLSVSQDEGWVKLNFPAIGVKEISVIESAISAFGITPVAAYASEGKYVVFEYESSKDILNVKPNFNEMLKWDERAIIVTARGDDYDFVSRMFAPKIGVNEDPVTGSAHTRLIPFWSKKLNKEHMLAKQLSERGGVLKCKHLGDRVEMSGQAVLFLKGEIYI